MRNGFFARLVAILLLCGAVRAAAADINDIARELIQTLPHADARRTDLRAEGEIKRVEIIMRVHSIHLNHIFKFGFLNQYQSKRSSGSYSHDRRIAAENKMLGTEFEMHPTSLHPKYGTLHVENGRGLQLTPNTKQYGNVIFKFKDQIVPRVTYSMTDSLGTPVVSPLSGMARLGANLDIGKVAQFLEAQIWGELTLNDVAEIWLDESLLEDAEIRRVARQHGINVYKIVDAAANDWKIAKDRMLVENNAGRGSVFAEPSVHQLEQMLYMGVDTHWRAAALDYLGRIGSSEALAVLGNCRRDGFCGLSNEALQQAQAAVPSAMRSLTKLFKQARSERLQAAIASYFAESGWAVPSEMRGLAGTSPKPAAAPAPEVHERPVAVAVEPKPRPAPAPHAVSHAAEDDDASGEVHSMEITHHIRAVLRSIRTAEADEERRRYLSELNDLLADTSQHGTIIEKLGSHSRFAHVVAKYADRLPRPFVDAFYRYLKALPVRDSALLRAYESCAAIFGEAA